MEYILDTNLLLAYIRKTKIADYLDNQYAPLSPINTPIISVVSIGEIKSLALRNQWGKVKTNLL